MELYADGKDEKLYIVAMGLPARGKSTLVIRLKETFIKNGIPTRIFNNGESGANTWL